MPSKHIRRFIVLCLLLCTPFLQAQKSESEESFHSGRSEVRIPMDDGVFLATDICIPKKHGEFPVVLVRTPYNKDAEQWLGKAFNIFGIAVVVQDCRGKFKSEGTFYPFINERADGLTTLRWIRDQPWSNGTVSGWGSSYQGISQWSISDSLDFMSLMVTGASLYDFLYPDGVFSMQTAFVWGLQNAGPNQIQIPSEKLRESFMQLPLSVADDSTIKDIPFLNDWLTHDTYDTYWEKMNFRGINNSPMISLAGWYDIFLKTQISDFQASLEAGDSESRLIIGPWCHGSQSETNEYGGIKKTGKPQKVFKYVKNFLKGKNNRLTSPLTNSRYSLFIMERNEYLGSDEWPPIETRTTPYYIGPENYIGPEKQTESGILEYEYAPDDPYPSHGGTALGEGVGPARQNENVGREDQLVFEKEPQEEPLILLGPVSATLWLSSDASCTHFVVGLQDVFPGGKIINIQEGIARVEFNDDQPRKTEISVWATGYQLNPGHSLRIVIASSWFPRFNRSLNTCDPISDAIDWKNASQKVYYGMDTPSSINLPIYSMGEKGK